MKAGAVRQLAATALALVLTACGGGGGGGDSANIRAPLPQVVSDTYPAGDRLDLRSLNYFPAAAGDSWTYNHVQGGITTPGAVTRSVTGASADVYTISEATPGAQPDTETYRRTAAGHVLVDIVDLGTPPAARNLIGEILMYPEPFYPVGGTRTIVRQGNWGADEDGDGVNDSFRLEITQQLVGLETMALPLGSASTVHFRTVMALTLSPSSLQETPYTVTATEDSWWAPGIGLVQSDRAGVDSSNVTLVAPYRLSIASGSVGGTPLFTAQPDGTLTKLSLTHNALVFDASRNRYYASIPGSAGLTGNSIATIDAATGAISYSAAVGSEPFPMAVAPDGSALYVGLNGSGEVAKLTLPAMTEQYRVRLPTAPFFGTQLLPKSIAVSPVESDVIAVSTFDPASSSTNSGVVQIRAGALQPQMVGGLFTATRIGPLAYDGNGITVYGYNDVTTAFSLHAMSVLGDGLLLTNERGIDMGFSIRDVDWTSRGIVVHRGVYRASDLALLGSVTPGHCRAYSLANRMVCIAGSGKLALVDMSSFVTVAAPAFSVDSYPPTPDQLVPGAAGQVAMRFGSNYINAPATEVWLFTSPLLQ